ncbi:MAG: hypothetical protein RR337_12995, partial [Clostridia bacterium]
IIRLTTDPANARYSDTALFIAEYLAGIIQQPRDLRNQDLLDHIYALAGSKFAIMDGSGYAATVGEFISDRGLLYSNRRFDNNSPRDPSRRGCPIWVALDMIQSK